MRIILNSSFKMVHLYKTAKNKKHVRVIRPLRCQLTYRHPQFSSKGSKRALSHNKHTNVFLHSLHFLFAEVSGVLMNDLVPNTSLQSL